MVTIMVSHLLMYPIGIYLYKCHNPTLRSVRMRLTLPKDMNLESSGTPEYSKPDYRGQNTLH